MQFSFNLISKDDLENFFNTSPPPSSMTKILFLGKDN